jgi:glycolate oxidase FAD binding subunit
VTTFRPSDASQLREAIAWAVAEEQPLELLGGGTKRGIGRPVQAAHTLDLSALSGIRAYEAPELVLTAGAGTPLAEIEAALAAQNQMLAFEPPDWGTEQTIGGVLSANFSGPRRITAGAARDHFLGFSGVSGRGEAFKAGGKVVKNVTGYDLPKLIAGAWGTLAALEEVTVKVLPRPEKSRTVLLFGLDDRAAVAALATALGSPHEASGAAHLPADVASRSSVSYVAGAGKPVTAVRLEGFGPSVEFRCRAVREMLGGGNELHSHNTTVLWREIGAAKLLDAAILWRVSVAPSAGPAIADSASRLEGARWFYDWAGGLVWIALYGGVDAGAAALREAIAAAGGGHATLLRAPEALPADVPIFEPLPPGIAALSRRVKESFDPKGILNPGRMGF